MIWFRILWIFNALMSLIPIAFFFIGLSDGTVDGDNIGLWMLILAVVGIVLGGSHWLKTKNQMLAAKILLMIASIPGLVALLYIAMFIFGDVRWN